MREKEHNLQVSCLNWFRTQHKGKLIYSIPNGGQRNKIVAAKLKAEGVMSGVPDIHIPVPNRFYHGMYIEMKVKPNKPTDNQLSVMKELEKCGYKCVVCYSIESFMEEVNRYFDFL
jgi:hypothetical protein